MPTFYNQATLSYNDNVINSNVVTGELVEVLSAAKNSLTDAYQVGDKVTYTISIVNSGTTALNGISVTDDLGTYAFESLTLTPLTYVSASVQYFQNGVLQPTVTVEAGPPLVFSGINVPAGGNVVLVYETEVNSFAPPTEGSTITNSAIVSGAGITEVTISDTITAATGAVLNISKSICPETVVENGQLVYTFVIQNTGNADAVATDNVQVTDQFNPILDPIAVSLDNVPWSSPANYTYSTSTGLFQTVPGQITVPRATYVQDTVTGQWTITPGVTVLRVAGTV